MKSFLDLRITKFYFFGKDKGSFDGFMSRQQGSCRTSWDKTEFGFTYKKFNDDTYLVLANTSVVIHVEAE